MRIVIVLGRGNRQYQERDLLFWAYPLCPSVTSDPKPCIAYAMTYITRSMHQTPFAQIEDPCHTSNMDTYCICIQLRQFRLYASSLYSYWTLSNKWLKAELSGSKTMQFSNKNHFCLSIKQRLSNTMWSVNTNIFCKLQSFCYHNPEYWVLQ